MIPLEFRKCEKTRMVGNLTMVHGSQNSIRISTVPQRHHNKYKLLYCRCGVVVMRIEFVKVVGHRTIALSCTRRQLQLIWALWERGEGYLLISPCFSAPFSPTLTKFCTNVARLLLRYVYVSDLLQLLAFWNYKLVFSAARCWKFWWGSG